MTAWVDGNTKAAPTADDMDGGGTDLGAGDTVNLATKSLIIDKSVTSGSITVTAGVFTVNTTRVLTLAAGANLMVNTSSISGTVTPSATSTIQLNGAGAIESGGILGARTVKYIFDLNAVLTVKNGGTFYPGQTNTALTFDIQTGGAMVIDASAATGKGVLITLVFDSNAASGYGTGGGTITLLGDVTYRVISYELGRLTVAGDGVVTDLGPTNGIIGGSGILVCTFAHMFHNKTLPKAGSTTLTDSEFWFISTGTAPVEQIVSGTWALVRSLFSSYAAVLWYVKPTGTVALTSSFLDHALPTIYSTSYYIVFFHMPANIVPVPAEKVLAEDVYLGSSGEYQEHIAYKSEGQEIDGRVSFDDLAKWNHALDHRLFVAQMNALLQDSDEFPKFTWHQGHYAKAELMEFIAADKAGEDSNVSSRYYKALVKARPYN
jgi:hypothetical protein